MKQVVKQQVINFSQINSDEKYNKNLQVLEERYVKK